MPTSKAQQRATNKYISKSYDRINLTLPKGQKQIIEEYAERHGMSINAFIRQAIILALDADTAKLLDVRVSDSSEEENPAGS